MEKNMTDENNPQGLSVDDAVELLTQAPETDTPEDDETVDVSEAEEVEEASEEVEDDHSDEEADETDEADDEEDGDEDPVIEWETAAGEKISKPLSELQAGYLRHSDYTRKTQEVAETRKSLEAKEQAAQEKITQLEEQLAQWAVEAQQEPDWLSLAQQLTPQEYNYQRELWSQQKARQEQARQEYWGLRQEQELREKKEKELRQKQGAETLKELIPDLRNEEKAPAITNNIVMAAKNLGYTDAELADIDDPRVFYGLHMVAQFLATQKKQSEVKKVVNKKVAEAKPKLNPGGAGGSKRQKLQKKRDEQMAQLKKTGSIKDAANLLLMG